MKSSNEVVLSRPKSFWERSLKLKKGDFFKSLLKVAINTVSSSLVPSPSSFVGLAQSAVDLLFSFSFKDPKKEEVAWLLISRSLALALHELVIETTSQFKLQKLEELTPTLEQFAEEADTYLDSLETSIDLDFFNHPERLSLLESVKEKLTEWLEKAGLSSYNAEAISDRLPAYFVFALNIEWQNRSSEYEVLKQLETPFTKAAEREQAWRKYYATLQKEVSKKVFDENFGLKQIYQPLRAFYPPQNHSESRHRQQKATNPADPPKKKVVDLEKKLLAWLETNDQREAIKVLCGGPGSGKSSFAKVFAANRDLQDRRKVVLIPLHRFTFTEDLSDAVGNFVAAYGLNNPIDLKDPEKGLLIIFDGLDELALSGKVGAEIARGFISEVRKKVDSAYSKEIPIKILITSRDLVIQTNIMEFRQQNQILHLIPYYEPNQTNYNDPENLLKKDYRDDWWRKFGELKGKIYDGIPEKLKEGKLGEVTAQPLLNYLVSLSFERGEIDFSKNSNINEIYEDLFKSVYDRDWEKRLHPGARSLEFDDFHLFFEKVAISAWHGDGRKTSEEEIKKNCKKSGIDHIFEQFQEQTKKSDLTNLLTAFYIRESDSRNSKDDKTFEFTHKSFSEYLTAKHILRQLKLTHDECEVKKAKVYKKGWDEETALKEWAELFGKTPIDEYLFDFLASEIDRCDT
ncbi:MAG: ATP-binding protein, partial [Blastocatellia bacterium]|nr:ATP-binding protein [Blastocatellia bacterium]